VLFLHPSKDQDVIQIDHHNAFCYEVSEDIIHHGLEGGWTVGYSKELSQTSFGHISINSSSILTVSMAMESP